jgi:hypothetical protein
VRTSSRINDRTASTISTREGTDEALQTADVNDVLELAKDALHEFWDGRRAGLLLPRLKRASQRLVEELVACGASVEVVVSYGSGALSLPDAKFWQVEQEGLPGHPDDDQTFHRWLSAPSLRFERWLADVDPACTLTFVGDSWTELPKLLGRPIHGWRRAQWAALEDKTNIDALWSEVGVPSPRFEIAACRRDVVGPIVSRLDRGLGVVVAIDATHGYSSGAAGLAWVRTAGELDAVLDRFSERSKRVRVAEFLPGMPCSLLAMVMEEGVAVFEPIEIITLADLSTGELGFCGSSNRWRPDVQTRDLLRSTARRVGEFLASTLGYRGMFSIDGILSDGTFYATELNPRHSSGLGLRVARPDFPIYLFHRGVQASLPGLRALSSSRIEQAFRALIRSAPSHSIVVPARAENNLRDPHRALTRPPTSGDAQPKITYTQEGGSAELHEVELPTEDGIMSGAACALARHLSGKPLWCFRNGIPLQAHI